MVKLRTKGKRMQPTQLPQGYQLVPIPEKKKFSIKAVIPTAQYGNIQPEYVVEAESYEEAEKVAMPYIERLWNQYCQKGAELKPRAIEETKEVAGVEARRLREITSELTGVTFWYDDANHKYYDKDFNLYIGGSTFAKKYQHEFDKENILAAMEEKHNIPQEDIEELWQLKGDASASFGTAVHAALEMYGKYHEIGKKLGAGKKPVVNTALHDQPALKKIVEAFYKDRMGEDAMYEAFIADDKLMWAGQIDRLKIVDAKKKICRVQDYKTNFDVNKKGFNSKLLAPFDNMPDTPLNGYWIQLSHYSRILINAGWTVEGMDIFHLDGEEWVTYTKEVIDLTDF